MFGLYFVGSIPTPIRCFSFPFEVYIIQFFTESLYCVHFDKVLDKKSPYRRNFVYILLLLIL